MLKVRMLLEPLEARCLLSSATEPLALPAVDFAPKAARPAIVAGPSPTAFSPSQIKHAYGIDQVKFGKVTGTGAGQTIAIIVAFDDPTVFVDLAAFDTQFSLPGTTAGQTHQFLTVVNQTGGATLPGKPVTQSTWALEESTDVQWIHAIAPGASLLVVECSSPSFSDLIGGGVNYARSQPGVSVVSMSFAGGEAPSDLPFDKFLTTPAKHAGVTFVAATGDNSVPATYPAVCPTVVSVGATTLKIANSTGSYGSETDYSNGGGGLSTYETQPGYQDNVVTQNQYFRATPDVSFLGNPDTGVPVCDSLDFGNDAPWTVQAGTSFGTAAWAAMIGIADQGRSLSHLAPLDGATGTLPRLYNLPAADFHDITAGSNGFSAGPGFDLATGRGTPIANKLIAGLTQDPAGPVVLSNNTAGLQYGLASSTTFTFSQAMNSRSFSIKGDVLKFTGPGGVNEMNQITSFKWINSQSLQLVFKPLQASGGYSLVLGPNVESSISNHRLDQNYDGSAGEATDIYTARFTVANEVGSNRFGYTAEGTAYQKTGLTPGAAGVTSILPGTDDGSTRISLGTNSFNFYGVTYTSLFVDSNGFLSFNTGGASDSEYANTDFGIDPTQPTIAPLWDDWTTGNAPSEAVLYQFTNPNKTGVPQNLVIEWHAVQNQGAVAMGSTATATFQVILQLNTGKMAGHIVFNYANLNLNESVFNNGGSATVGISAGGNSGESLLVSLDNPNDPLVGSGKAILIGT